MPVAEMLSRMSATELTEWRVYEEEVGMLGREWDREVAAQTYEVLTHIRYYAEGQAGNKHPDKPKPLPRAYEFEKPKD